MPYEKNSVNKVVLVGRLGSDPEVRQTNNGMQVANLSLATSTEQKDSNGEKQEATEWHRCVAFDKTAEAIGKIAGKGDMIYIEGRLQTRSYTDKQGVERQQTQIAVANMQMLNKKSGGEQGQKQENQNGNKSDLPF